jgi:cystathionine gamma-synthase
VSLPSWSHVVGYEEGSPDVVDRLTGGYPRFVFHHLVRDLLNGYRARYAAAHQNVIAFVSQTAAERCAHFLHAAGYRESRVEQTESPDIFVVVFPVGAEPVAKSFWQHAGWGVSSRRAAAVVEPGEGGACRLPESAVHLVRVRVAELAGVTIESVAVFPTGMAAIDATHQLLLTNSIEGSKGRLGIQFGFPYLDTLKVQEKFGRGVRHLPRGDAHDLQQLAALVDAGQISHVFTEVPCNPLLTTPPLPELSQILRPHGIPLIVDDTVGTFFNVDVKPYADIIVTSLTKFFSGAGDVAAGSQIINGSSPLAADLMRAREGHGVSSCLFEADAAVLERNSTDFLSRMERINSNAELLAEYLQNHPKVQKVFYPKFVDRERYEQLKTARGGYGGLLSIILKDAPHTAPSFFDRLGVLKGPGLGNTFTLACPYTLLAHFNELEWAEALGVSRYLIRVSVGTEETQRIIAVFEKALQGL